ncbi:gem-associated protein 6-like isoform X1 [Mizuhopecten yessoensis]|uniref:Gem-associated protein 6 n=1 Tax=Mizuhopecten yessoensis TaxID=6573 RepID=A0A210QSX9_MIZYE|nr:gem-associated protein 6-like isoform X1 [Mizuhopecten yessoensis]OWF51809.1 Gem-associated protein 6 [Mizuhopecten yessoensis]
MSDVKNDDVHRHPIFHKDPEQWLQYMNKEVLVVTEDGSEWSGWVYTVDPVSESMVLFQFEEERTRMEIVMGHAIRNVTILNSETQTHKDKFDKLFRTREQESFSEEEIERRRNVLKLWLVKNLLPVSTTGNNGEILSISDALYIEPPYGPENCRSTNEIILGRIQGLIKNMPADHENW